MYLRYSSVSNVKCELHYHFQSSWSNRTMLGPCPLFLTAVLALKGCDAFAAMHPFFLPSPITPCMPLWHPICRRKEYCRKQDIRRIRSQAGNGADSKRRSILSIAGAAVTGVIGFLIGTKSAPPSLETALSQTSTRYVEEKKIQGSTRCASLHPCPLCIGLL